MEICVEIIIEDVVNKERDLAGLSFLRFVGVDENGKGRGIGKVYADSKIEKRLYEGGAKGVEGRKEGGEESKKRIEFLCEGEEIEDI
ncbi:hypothetical protein [Staphylococcus hominis]|uniref:hypothetical protein n=1 Tax=Staphylococcus hominis TaxID=1290 RepID=UPI0021B5CCDF|nr:hypothetical protein [Staphylococcus hominis]